MSYTYILCYDQLHTFIKLQVIQNYSDEETQHDQSHEKMV